MAPKTTAKRYQRKPAGSNMKQQLGSNIPAGWNKNLNKAGKLFSQLGITLSAMGGLQTTSRAATSKRGASKRSAAATS